MNERSPFTSYGSTDPVQVAVVNPGFDSTTFDNVCGTITENIYHIHNSASNLSSTIRQISPNNYSQPLHDHIHSIQFKTNSVISDTTPSLQQISTMARMGNKQHRLKTERLRKEFQETVQCYSNLQKQVAEKIKKAILHSNQSGLMTQTTEWSADVDDKTQLLEEEAVKKQAQQQKMMEIENDHGLMLEREERIRQLESDMIDVNEIFQDLASMIRDQGEVVDRLEDHIEDASSNVEQGVTQLKQAALYQKKYRTKLCCFIVLILIIAVIITVIILLVRK